jgi:hypothetical protein
MYAARYVLDILLLSTSCMMVWQHLSVSATAGITCNTCYLFAGRGPRLLKHTPKGLPKTPTCMYPVSLHAVFSNCTVCGPQLYVNRMQVCAGLFCRA